MELCEENCTSGTCTITTFGCAKVWLSNRFSVVSSSTFILSTFFPSLSIPVLFGLDPVIVSDFLSDIIVLIKITHSLLIGNSLSAVSISTLINTPFHEVFLSNFQRFFLWLVDFCEGLEIRISFDIAFGFFISERVITGLRSLLFLALLFPVFLGVLDVAKANCLYNIRVLVKITHSFLVCHCTLS